MIPNLFFFSGKIYSFKCIDLYPCIMYVLDIYFLFAIIENSLLNNNCKYIDNDFVK